MSEQKELSWGQLINTVSSGRTVVDLGLWGKNTKKLQKRGGVSVDQHARLQDTLYLLKHAPKKEN